MLTNRKSVALLPLFALVIFLGGCKPSGPDALLEGERLIREGDYAAAQEKLKLAVELLPFEAQAWNHLGLAHHGASQPREAAQAYRKALDLEPNLAIARYNLGCLLLELNQPAEAARELTSFTLLQSRAEYGWLKKATAELRSQQYAAAEKSFQSALALYPKLPEALNGLGMIQLSRNRPADALKYFTQALQVQSNYPPALLNVAILSHRWPPGRAQDYRPFALQKYREYLALKPRPANWPAVEEVAHRLDLELHPPPPPQAPTLVASVKTNGAPTTNTPAAAPPPVTPPTKAAESRPAAVTNTQVAANNT
ncbi:MAG: tetratricopeptide repeat protein, partial [Verrucomicrobiota bacterium]